MIEKVERRDGVKVYVTRMGAKPSVDAFVNRAQATAFKAVIFELDLIYVDLAVWGPHAERMVKLKSFRGVAFGPDGKITTVEMKGPPNFMVWLAAFKVFRTACIMYNVITPERLDAYSEKIATLHAKNPALWPLLYQADVRTRLEHMPRVRDDLQGEYDKAISNGQVPDTITFFNPVQPWEGVFDWIVKGEAKWWKGQYEDPCLYITCDASELSYHVDSDAPVADKWTMPATSSMMPDAAAALTSTQTRGRKRARSSSSSSSSRAPARRSGKTKKKNRKQDKKTTKGKVGFPAKDPATGFYTHNRNDEELCKTFQRGKCQKTQGGNRCPANSSFIHQCGKCLKVGHGAESCKASFANPDKSKRFK